MKTKRQKSRRYGVLIIAIFLLLVAAGTVTYRHGQSSFTAQADIETPVVTTKPLQKLSWPRYGQSAIATKDYGVFAIHGDRTPQPTASTAKLITVLAIMQKKPFNDGKGATIIFTESDVERYNEYVAKNGTVARVSAGLRWTQYQALQAMLLASSNNVSDSLAIWAFGSLEAYREYAQAMVRKIGMYDTMIGVDASGYSPTTTSTAHDMALLAARVLDNPTLREIAGQPDATLPEAGTIKNHSYIDNEKVVGMKIGYIPEAGGAHVLAGKQTIDNHTHEIITVVLGAPKPFTARDDAYQLYKSAKANFSYQAITTKGQQVGAYRPSWSQPIPITAQRSVGAFVWNGSSPEMEIDTRELRPNDRGNVGTLTIEYGEWSTAVPLVTNVPLGAPPWWRHITG